ncbi:Na+/H+ antiporter NhaA [Streptomyces sp. NPDC051569]|uniref:Na+/H+ antiporter NhaA n=1 Tax=Streptomyces sp. NPDC051569 TaxID=3365661 RepID=UPI0037B876B2
MYTPLRDFLRTETGSAAVLLTATLAALIWANAAPGTYTSFWHAHISIHVSSASVALDLREWVNSGLMTLFFFVVGLETRREFDMGELRERKRLTLPLLAGISGMLVPVAIYLAFNAGHDSAHGWGTAISTDTAFALGMLAVFGTRLPRGLRVFILTVSVVDDFVVLAVIAIAYSEHVNAVALGVALGIFAVVLLVRAAGVAGGVVYGVLAVAVWVGLLKSGVDPVVTGLAMGLLTYAYPASRSDLERASGLFRLFREQPTPELERSLRAGLATAISPNARLQRIYHPWSSYVIVPVFALANAGIALSGDELSRAFGSPITLGIIVGYLVGKPVGTLAASTLTTWLSRGRLRPPVGWGATAVGGTISAVGFTVALLISALVFEGDRLSEAKIGILVVLIGSFAVTWLLTWVINRLPRPLRIRTLLGKAESVIDLSVPVDPAHDHVRGPLDAHVTLVEYGDFECPYCGLAEPVIRELLVDDGDIRYVWRHLPLIDVHPNAQLAAEASEAAGAQGRFWEMHDLLLVHQGDLLPVDLLRYAEEVGLDTERFHRDLREHEGADRVAEDVDSADMSGVSGTPTFFVNGRRHHGAYDISGLSAAVRAARERSGLLRP